MKDGVYIVNTARGELLDIKALYDNLIKGKVKGITAGIPCDSVNNEIKVWVKQARSVNPDLRIAIKAAADTPYPIIHQLMSSLQDIRENRYNLITTLKNIKEDE